MATNGRLLEVCSILTGNGVRGIFPTDCPVTCMSCARRSWSGPDAASIAVWRSDITPSRHRRSAMSDGETARNRRAGSQGGTVRGDDRSCRYPPRGVWFGLILTAMTVRALVAQDAPRRRNHAPAQGPGLAGCRSRDALERARRRLGSPLGQCRRLARARDRCARREAIVRISDESTRVR